MEITDRSLIGLKLLLAEFDIAFGSPLSIEAPAIDFDRVAGVVRFMQELLPMGYPFSVTKARGKLLLTCNQLATEVALLRTKNSRGDLLLAAHRHQISDKALRMVKIAKLLLSLSEVPFDRNEWMYFVGFYSLVTAASPDLMTWVLMEYYPRFVPYIGEAEELLTKLKERKRQFETSRADFFP